MPNEILNAVEWALQQSIAYNDITVQITKDMPMELVDKVREYFNVNNIPYSTFSYDDLVPYL